MKKSLKKFRNNIIFFCPSIEEGGVEKNLINISNGLSYNHNVSLITANKNKKSFLIKKLILFLQKVIFLITKVELLKVYIVVIYYTNILRTIRLQ